MRRGPFDVGEPGVDGRERAEQLAVDVGRVQADVDECRAHVGHERAGAAQVGGRVDRQVEGGQGRAAEAAGHRRGGVVNVLMASVEAVQQLMRLGGEGMFDG
jgi:hypothetical protein